MLFNRFFAGKGSEAMGYFFRMSNRFNKRKPCDFGLVELQEEGYAIDPEDGSVWHRCSLYDFGWGAENGFYRTPIPEYCELLKIVLESDEYDDVFGAAAIILEDYPDELLVSCEEIFTSANCEKKKRKLAEVFQLRHGINHSRILGKTYQDIVDDANRWSAIGNLVKITYPKHY